MKPAYDFVIIGSGFGGSVSAYRLATEQRRLGKPVSVCVIERGKRYNRSQFPRDIGRSKDFLFREDGRKGWQGLIDFRYGDYISVMCAAGVGGTSLVYLDVQVDAFDSTFDIVGPEGRKRWPESVNWHAEMPEYYGRMFRMMRPSPIPSPLLKTLALREAACGAGIPERFKLVDLAIFWGKTGGEQGMLFEDPYDARRPAAGCLPDVRRVFPRLQHPLQEHTGPELPLVRRARRRRGVSAAPREPPGTRAGRRLHHSL